jgi:hypothetical protein
MARFLIIFGVLLVVIGLMWPLLSNLGLGRLPGDIVVERGNVTFYFPIVTSLLVSLFLSVLLSIHAEPLVPPTGGGGPAEGTPAGLRRYVCGNCFERETRNDVRKRRPVVAHRHSASDHSSAGAVLALIGSNVS